MNIAVPDKHINHTYSIYAFVFLSLGPYELNSTHQQKRDQMIRSTNPGNRFTFLSSKMLRMVSVPQAFSVLIRGRAYKLISKLVLSLLFFNFVQSDEAVKNCFRKI